ncbi:MAG: hypothetical protein ABSE72_11575 [Bacteroidales bacterium]|jgi:hypothetical protein
MPKEIFPSSVVCDCGQECHFFERTIRELKKMSIRKKGQVLIADDGEHEIIFENGEFVAMYCPKEQKEIPVTTIG